MKKLLISLFIVFIIWSLCVFFNVFKGFDQSIYNFIISFRCDFLDNFFKLITKLGNTKTIILLIFLTIVIFYNKLSLYLSSISVVSSAVMIIIKNIIRRDRPHILRLITQGGFSYPSGHSMISICFYGFIAYYIINKTDNKIIKYLILTLSILLILLIGISRIYVGVHYPSDVIGGYLVSAIILIICINYYIKGSDKND